MKSTMSDVVLEVKTAQELTEMVKVTNDLLKASASGSIPSHSLGS